MMNDSMTGFNSPCCDNVAMISQYLASSKSISQALTGEYQNEKEERFSCQVSQLIIIKAL